MRWTNTFPAILCILIWSFCVHLPGLDSPFRDYHAYRQAQTASMARNYVRHGMHFLTPELDSAGTPARAGTEFPIYSFLLAIAFKILGVKELWGRLLSSVFAAWGAIYLYFVVKRRLGESIAAWSALLMCSIPIHIYFTRSVQPEPMALWGLLGFLYYADQWYHVKRSKLNWILAVLLGSTAPLLKLPYLYILLPMLLYLAWEERGFFNLFRIDTIAMLGSILALVVGWYEYAKTAPVVVLPLGLNAQIKNLTPVLSWNLWRAQFISRIPEVVTTYSGLFFAALGMYYYRRARAHSYFMYWTVVGALYVPLLGEYGMIHKYTLLPLAPIAAVWIACGISMFREYVGTHPKLKIVAILLILGIPIHAGFRIKHWYRLEYGYLERAHATLARASKSTDLVLVSTHEMPQVLYYLDRYGFQVDPNEWKTDEVELAQKRGVQYIFIPEEDNRKSMERWKSYLRNRAILIESDPEYAIYHFSARQG